MSAARPPCDPSEHGYAFVDPSGKVHVLDKSHPKWAEDYLSDHPELGSWLERIGGLLKHGWIRVANITNLSVAGLDVPPKAAWKAVLDMVVDCVRKGMDPDAIIRVDHGVGDQERSSAWTAADFARRFGGRAYEDAVFEAALSRPAVRRTANSTVDKDWVTGIKKAWLAVAGESLRAKDDVECLRHLDEVARWVDLLAEDLLFNKGFLATPHSLHLDSLPAQIKQKIHGELMSVKRELELSKNIIEGVRDSINPKSVSYKFDGGRIWKMYQDKDPRSPQRAFHADVREWTGEGIRRASEIMTRKVFRALNENINKYGPIDFGSIGPLEYDVQGVKVIYEDFPYPEKGALAQFPRKDAPRESYRHPDPESYVRYLREVYAKLRQADLQYLWYGILRIRCKQCGGDNPYGAHFGVGGHYFSNRDEIRVYMDSGPGIVPLLIHEIGHRYYYRFMSASDRARFDSYFAGASAKAVWKTLLRYSQDMSDKHSALLGVFRKDPQMLSDMSMLVRTYFDQMLPADQATVAGWLRGVPSTSEYGSVSSAEDFAEVFSDYVMGVDLSRDQVERFKAFLGRRRRTAAKLAARREVDCHLKYWGLAELIRGGSAKLYHGTTRQFQRFDAAYIRHDLINRFYKAPGIFLAPKESVASRYAMAARNSMLPTTVVGDLTRRNPGAGMVLGRLVREGEDAWDGLFADATAQFPSAETPFDALEQVTGGVDPNTLMDIAQHIEGSKYDRGAADQTLFDLWGMTSTETPDYILNDLDKVGLDSSEYRPKIYTVSVSGLERVLVTKSKSEAEKARSRGYDAVVFCGADLVDGAPEVVVFDPSKVRVVKVEVVFMTPSDEPHYYNGD